MLEHVVVGIGREDASDGDAIALAKQLVSPSGRLTLVHVIVVTGGAPVDSSSTAVTLTAQVSRVEAQSVSSGLHRFAAEHGADLLVVGASRSDGASRAFPGDRTAEVLQDAPCAVAVAPDGYADRAAGIHRIGVAHDGPPDAARVLTLARSLAAERRAELSAFAPAGARDRWDVMVEPDHHVEEVRRQLAALLGIAAPAELDDPVGALDGDGGSVDLLVIGSPEDPAIARLLQWPSDAQACAPVLVVSARHSAHNRPPVREED